MIRFVVIFAHFTYKGDNMFLDSIKKLLGLDPNDRALQKYSGLVDIINSYSQDIHAKSDGEIQSRFNDLRSQVQARKYSP